MPSGLGQDKDVPIEIRRGNNDPAVIWEFLNADGTPANLAGSVFELVVAWTATSYSAPDSARQPGDISHSSDATVDLSASALIVDASLGRVTWPYTMAETDEIPRTTVPSGPRYVLRRTIGGKTRDWTGGPVIIRSYLP